MDWCKNQERCGGCFYQEIPYEEELDKKKEEIQQLFSGIRRRTGRSAWDCIRKEAFLIF